jgi:hypothetical protein
MKTKFHNAMSWYFNQLGEANGFGFDWLLNLQFFYNALLKSCGCSWW